MNLRTFFPMAALAFMMFGASGIYAQQTVQGTVTDPLGAVVGGAKVTLLHGDTGETTTTNEQGVYTFSSVAEGRYRLQVEAAGFVIYTGPETFVGSSGTTTVDALLQLSTVSQGVSVTATGSEVPIAQVGSSVSVIDSEDIQAQNKLDVLENLRQVAGAQIVQTSQRGGPTFLFIRGGDYDFNKVMIDGAPANNIGGDYDFAQLSNGGVESIEVLEGANSGISTPPLPIAPTFPHKNSNWGFVPGVESVLCHPPLAFPEQRAELRIMVMQGVAPSIQKAHGRHPQTR
jgi:vitamin B12 transporter